MVDCHGGVDCHERNDVDEFYRYIGRFDRHINQINGKRYWYEHEREGGKVGTKYLGKVDAEKTELIERIRQLEDALQSCTIRAARQNTGLV